MPGNQIVINNGIKYYVGDSKIEELLAWLDINGIKKEGKADAQSKSTNTEKEQVKNTRNGA